jgi:hypothetical protein
MGITEKIKYASISKKLMYTPVNVLFSKMPQGFLHSMQSPNTLEKSEQVLMRQVVQTIGK